MKQFSCMVEKHLAGQDGIPVLACYVPGRESGPLVFLQHGYTGCKEMDLQFGMRIAQEGYFVVLPDARLHGERRPPDFQQIFESDFYNRFVDVIEGTVQDITQLIDYFGRDEAGLAGISMGGFITFLAAVREPRLKAVVPIIGSPKLLPGPDTPADQPGLDRFDVIPEAEKIRPKAILVLNGMKDEIVRPDGVMQMDPVLRDLYRDIPERYELVLFENVGHEVTEEMKQRTVDWFKKHLPVR
jgi:pimeloyl-ACP methyl ester carboxylesterase